MTKKVSFTHYLLWCALGVFAVAFTSSNPKLSNSTYEFTETSRDADRTNAGDSPLEEYEVLSQAWTDEDRTKKFSKFT